MLWCAIAPVFLPAQQAVIEKAGEDAQRFVDPLWRVPPVQQLRDVADAPFAIDKRQHTGGPATDSPILAASGYAVVLEEDFAVFRCFQRMHEMRAGEMPRNDRRKLVEAKWRF